MFVPCLHTRIEQPDHLFCLRIDGRQIWAFVAVAVGTGQRKFGRIIAAIVLSWDDMLDMELCSGCSYLRRTPILATCRGSATDKLSQ